MNKAGMTKKKIKTRQLSERWKPPEQGWVTTTRLILRGVRLYLTEVGGLGLPRLSHGPAGYRVTTWLIINRGGQQKTPASVNPGLIEAVALQ
jgi:hypothetical protein